MCCGEGIKLFTSSVISAVWTEEESHETKVQFWSLAYHIFHNTNTSNPFCICKRGGIESTELKKKNIEKSWKKNFEKKKLKKKCWEKNVGKKILKKKFWEKKFKQKFEKKNFEKKCKKNFVKKILKKKVVVRLNTHQLYTKITLHKNSTPNDCTRRQLYTK